MGITQIHSPRFFRRFPIPDAGIMNTMTGRCYESVINIRNDEKLVNKLGAFKVTRFQRQRSGQTSTCTDTTDCNFCGTQICFNGCLGQPGGFSHGVFPIR